jgi:hypothetical protein
VVDIIILPKFDDKVAKKQAHQTKVKLPEEILEQLHDFIAEVALLYNDNPCGWRKSCAPYATERNVTSLTPSILLSSP